MKKLLRIQQKLIPQVIELMERRYLLLRQISLSEPVGRRSLSNILGIKPSSCSTRALNKWITSTCWLWFFTAIL